MKSKPNYKLLIGYLLIIVAACIIVVALLAKLEPRNKTTANNIPGAADIIKQYQAPGTINQLTDLYNKDAQPQTGLETINYTADKSYTIYLKATDTVEFKQKDKTTPTNSPLVKASSEAFLVKKGLQKKSPATGANTPLFAIFDSSQTVCQLFDLPPLNETGALLNLACVKKSAIDDQYATINKFLALYNGPKSAIANPAGIMLRTTKESNKSLAVTDIYGLKSASGATSLIFAAIDDKWEYIGQRAISNGDTQIDNSISAKLKTALNNPKYQGFLLEHVQ